MLTAENFPVIASLMIFISILLLFLGAFAYRSHAKSRSRLLSSAGPSDGLSLLPPNGSAEIMGSRSPRPLLKTMKKIGQAVEAGEKDIPKGRSAAFLQAGIRNGDAPTIFMGTKVLLASLSAAGLFLLGQMFLRHLLPSHRFLVAASFAAAAYYLPNIWLRVRTSTRKRNIQNALPDALDLLVVCVEAGMSLDASLQRVGQEMRLQCRELSDELFLMNLEIRAGKSRRDALKNLAVRTGLEDVNSLVTLLIQTEQFGPSISQALRVYSDTFRTKRMQRAEEIAAKLPVKLLLPLVLFIFPSIFVVLLGPAAINIFRVLIKK